MVFLRMISFALKGYNTLDYHQYGGFIYTYGYTIYMIVVIYIISFPLLARRFSFGPICCIIYTTHDLFTNIQGTIF
jgi:hypothetical protein